MIDADREDAPWVDIAQAQVYTDRALHRVISQDLEGRDLIELIDATEILRLKVLALVQRLRAELVPLECRHTEIAD